VSNVPKYQNKSLTPARGRYWVRHRAVRGLVGVAALLSLVAGPTAGAATVSPVPALPSPATVLTLSPFSDLGGIAGQLQGIVCQARRTCVPVNFPILVPPGVPILGDAIKSTSEPIIVFGFSEGAQVAEQWLWQHANDADNPKNLTFVVVGNSTRAYGGSLNSGPGSFGEVWPQSQYQVIDVARQYDYSADFPNNPSPYFLLAVVNALAGGLGTHDYTGVNLYDPANTVFKVGNITYVLVPTPNLPLVGPLRALGLNPLADQLQAQLKPLVDQAYNRDYPGIIQPGVIAAQPAATATTSGASTLSAPVVSDSAASVTGAPMSSASIVSGATVASQDATVPGTLALAPTAESAPAATRPAKTTTPPAAQPGPDNAIADEPSTTAPTTRTTATSTNRSNKERPGEAGGNESTASGKKATASGKKATTNTAERPTSTKRSEKGTNSDR
jgi:diacyltrehalose acyltransferase